MNAEHDFIVKNHRLAYWVAQRSTAVAPESWRSRSSDGRRHDSRAMDEEAPRRQYGADPARLQLHVPASDSRGLTKVADSAVSRSLCLGAFDTRTPPPLRRGGHFFDVGPGSELERNELQRLLKLVADGMHVPSA